MLLLQRTQRQSEGWRVDTFTEAVVAASINMSVYVPFVVNIQ
jgi:hypothetical protein